MQIYLVGGAVRDRLLGRTITEKDWVVVGATPADLLAKGFRQVGRDFPVFLHPNTNEEYALARTERKTGKGYTNFVFDTSATVTLEDDLRRRDLTINAIAETPEGALIDPFNGQKDLDNRILRHVSDAFIEDPVRILRVARFAARFTEYGFHLAPETLSLMQKMVELGEVDALVPERVWKEFERALAEKNPEIFFAVLADCDALKPLFGDLFAANSAGIQALKNAVVLSPNPMIRFAALTYDQGYDVIHGLCAKYRIPAVYKELALIVSNFHRDYARSRALSAEEITDLLQHVDAFRRPSRFKFWLLACEACESIQSADWLLQCLEVASSIDAKALAANLKGPEIAEKIRSARIEAIHRLTSKNS
ncbi:MAG: multifunctional CCA tRNA nucleotidyl transferase/2'3'-cyclic phosphodiesterase/2'nucleotidase/phosphatase [Gammaproteobacteria bacterium]|nr:multifunctional CCA tRNA nucleotidyl transferase/2'3'-cyclic phosphodiesterase/2'nucleotidase/phosphatase [Gammaproteobacteria bacterium]